jgi:hypothetical protein
MDKKVPPAKSDTLYFEDEQFKYVCRKSETGDPWFNGTTWVDLLNPETVKTFIEFSYKPYLERYRDEMGKTAPGMLVIRRTTLDLCPHSNPTSHQSPITNIM